MTDRSGHAMPTRGLLSGSRVLGFLGEVFVVIVTVSRIAAGGDHLRSRPIGIFDSGTGGLAVLEQILKADGFDNRTGEPRPGGDRRPDFESERFLFLADQANMPYGNYPAMGRQAYLQDLIVCDARFLLGFPHPALTGGSPRRNPPAVKAVVIACNTATAYGKKAIDDLVSETRMPVEVVGVIDAGAQGAIDALGRPAEASAGVLATEGTVASGIYAKMIAAAAGQHGMMGVSVVQQGAYGLAGAIDGIREFIDADSPTNRPRANYQGPALDQPQAPIDLDLLPRYGFDFEERRMLWSGERSRPAVLQLNSVENYLAYHLVSLLERLRGIRDAKPLGVLVLGCTHFPLLEKEIRAGLLRLYNYREDGQYVYRRYLTKEVKLVDPALFVAREVYRRLGVARLATPGQEKTWLPRGEFYITVPSRQVPGVQIDAQGGFTHAYKYGVRPVGAHADIQVVPLMRSTLSSESAKRLARQVPTVWRLMGGSRE